MGNIKSGEKEERIKTRPCQSNNERVSNSCDDRLIPIQKHNTHTHKKEKKRKRKEKTDFYTTFHQRSQGNSKRQAIGPFLSQQTFIFLYSCSKKTLKARTASQSLTYPYNKQKFISVQHTETTINDSDNRNPVASTCYTTYT